VDDSREFQTVPIAVNGLRCEYKENPIGIDVEAPRLSWQIISKERGVVQSAYHIRVAHSVEDLVAGQNVVWDSGKVACDASVHRRYSGPALVSRQRYYWQVRVWDGDDEPSAWSEPAFWEMGLLDLEDWQAE